jgi:hypothetical protein
MQQVGDALLADPGEVRLVTEAVTLAAYKRAALLELPMDGAQKHINAAKAKVIASIGQCDSPIERRMLPALVFANYGHAFASFPAELHCPKVDTAPPKGDLIVIPQFAFIRSRLDFAVIAKAEGRQLVVAVECDGAEFHKDADKDRARDAYLKAFDVTVFRFSGRQIQADPLPLASLVAHHVADWRASL